MGLAWVVDQAELRRPARPVDAGAAGLPGGVGRRGRRRAGSPCRLRPCWWPTTARRGRSSRASSRATDRSPRSPRFLRSRRPRAASTPSSLVARLACAPARRPGEALALLGLPRRRDWPASGGFAAPSQGEGADSLSGVLIVLSVLTCIYHQIYDAVLLAVPLLAVAAAKNDVVAIPLAGSPRRPNCLARRCRRPTTWPRRESLRLLNPPGRRGPRSCRSTPPHSSLPSRRTGRWPSASVSIANIEPLAKPLIRRPASPHCGFNVSPCRTTRNGWGGIRTPGGLTPTAVFKTAALDHSATHPSLLISMTYDSRSSRFCLLDTRSDTARLASNNETPARLR